MGLQRYRADKAWPVQDNGAAPWAAVWGGGESLALIRNCPCKQVLRAGAEYLDLGRRTVYVTGEPDTYFSQPAAIAYQGKTLRGFISSDESVEHGFQFTAYANKEC